MMGLGGCEEDVINDIKLLEEEGSELGLHLNGEKTVQTTRPGRSSRVFVLSTMSMQYFWGHLWEMTLRWIHNDKIKALSPPHS